MIKTTQIVPTRSSGFVLLGKKNRQLGTDLSAIAKLLAEEEDYEVVQTIDDF